MKMIFEKDIEHCDFIELILSKDEVDEIEKSGLVNEFENVLSKGKSLNIFLHTAKED